MTECDHFANQVNLCLAFTGVGGLISNVFPLYVILKFQNQCTRFGRDVLIASLCIVDILTVLVPLVILLSVQDRCVAAESATTRSWICEMFFLMFVWLKLCAMFLITTLNYSSYLALNVKGLYRDRLSIGDHLSNSFYRSKSRGKRLNGQGQSTVVIANLVIGVALVAFVISSLPYIGLGPKGVATKSNSTLQSTQGHGKIQLCHLGQISSPLKGKEYTFLFAVLMISTACLILHLVHSVLSCFGCCFWNANLRQAQELDIQVVNRNPDGSDGGGLQVARSVHGITNSYARMTFTLGVFYFATWVPLMVAMGTLMSGHVFMNGFEAYSMSGAFINPFVGPVIYGAFIAEYRQGYVHLLNKIFLLINVFKEFVLKFTKKGVFTPTNQADIQPTSDN